MYARLGQAVDRYAVPIVVGWLLLLALLLVAAPKWRTVTQDGEFAFLPAHAQTKLAAEVYRQAFLTADAPEPGTAAAESAADGDSDSETARPRGGLNPLDSNIVIVVHRKDQLRPQEGMAQQDYQFIEEYIVPRLEEIAATTGRGYDPLTPEELAAPRPVLEKSARVVVEILTRPPIDPPQFPHHKHVVGALLESENDAHRWSMCSSTARCWIARIA